MSATKPSLKARRAALNHSESVLRLEIFPLSHDLGTILKIRSFPKMIIWIYPSRLLGYFCSIFVIKSVVSSSGLRVIQSNLFHEACMTSNMLAKDLSASRNSAELRKRRAVSRNQATTWRLSSSPTWRTPSYLPAPHPTLAPRCYAGHPDSGTEIWPDAPPPLVKYELSGIVVPASVKNRDTFVLLLSKKYPSLFGGRW